MTAPRQLLDEYLSAMQMQTMPFAKAEELAAEGIPWTAIAAVCPVPMRITINRAGDRFKPDAAGQSGWVLPITAVDPGRPELIETNDPVAAISTGPLVDLAATFSPAAPGRWALRRGRATVLGAIEPQYLQPDPVRVHRDIAAWLRAGCTGIVLLTGDPDAAQRVLRQVDRIDNQDVEPVVAGGAPAVTARSSRPLDRRLEGLVRKIITASQVQREGTLRWACHVLGAAAGSGEIRPEVARALLVRARDPRRPRRDRGAAAHRGQLSFNGGVQ